LHKAKKIIEPNFDP